MFLLNKQLYAVRGNEALIRDCLTKIDKNETNKMNTG